MPRKQKKDVDLGRRKFLGASTAAAVGGIVAGGVVGGVAGYFGAPTKEVIKDVPVDKRFKAGFVYVGPIGDFGWTHAHNRGRLFAQQELPWLDTVALESVEEATSEPRMDNLVAQGNQMIFTTSFGFMDPTAKAAESHPDVIFEHCSGFRSGAAGNAPSNMGSYFAEFYQLYYLCGLAAGAMSKTGTIGYVAAFPIPEVVRHLNAFVLGARAVNPEIKAQVIWQFTWFDPTKTRLAATSLIDDKNADVLAFTEDSPTTLQVAQEYQAQRGKKIWSFSHYDNMQQYGPDAHLTGQVVEWGPIYVDLISRAFNGGWSSLDIWTRAGDYDPFRWQKKTPDPSKLGLVEGTVHPAPLNPVIPDQYRALIARRWEEMKEMLFEPFTGPIRDQDGVLRVKDGERLNHDDLWSMLWQVEGIQTSLPKA